MGRIRLVSVFVLALLILGACAPKTAPAQTSSPASSPKPAATPPAAPQVGEWDKVLAAAKKEGTVVIYSTSAKELTEASREPLSQLGIKVEIIGMGPADLMGKISAEQRAGAYVGDLLTGGWTNPLMLMGAGYAQPVGATLPSLQEKGVWKEHPSKLDPTNSAFIPSWGLVPSVIVNTDLVKPGEIQSWQDLLDPKWKDKMAMTDPRSGVGPGASGQNAWSVLGEDFWKKIAAQRPSLQVNMELPTQYVTLGEKSLAIFPNYLRSVSAIKAGAPIRIVHLKEGTVYWHAGVAVIKNAPHPNATAVFLNWLFSKEGQAANGRTSGNFTVRNDVKEDWITIQELRPGAFTLLEPSSTLDPKGSQKGAEFATKIFGAR